MKVGIMSMQRVHNLGSFLQAYGLMETINKTGKQVEFIDIPKGEPYENAIFISDKKDKNIILDKINKLFYYKNIKKYKKIHNKYYENEFENYLNKYLKLTKKISDSKCDCLVVGSDEVFNCLNYEQGFTTDTFGTYKNSSKNISYAASCGWTKIEFLSSTQKDKIKEALKNMSAISVRDLNTKHFVEKLTDKKVELHLDPVLIADFDTLFEKKEKRIIKEKYILIYGYYNRISNINYIKKIKQIAKKKKCKLVALGAPQYWCDEYITINPKHIIDVFKNAEFIITDTFHGTILSIKAQNEFITFLRKSNNNKLKFLLDYLKLSERIVTNKNEIESKLYKKIDFTETNRIIESEKKKSKDYLKNNI